MYIDVPNNFWLPVYAFMLMAYVYDRKTCIIAWWDRVSPRAAAQRPCSSWFGTAGLGSGRPDWRSGGVCAASTPVLARKLTNVATTKLISMEKYHLWYDLIWKFKVNDSILLIFENSQSNDLTKCNSYSATIRLFHSNIQMSNMTHCLS